MCADGPTDLKMESHLALYFDSMNDKNWNTVKDIQRRCSHTVSFSHFISRSVNYFA